MNLLTACSLAVLTIKSPADDHWSDRDLDVVSVSPSRPEREIVVAVIDTGLDPQHPLFRGRLWKNRNEIATNLRDDDGNGLIDDVHGWDFVTHQARLIDRHGHGTHVAGLILRHAPKAKIMSLRYYDPSLDPGATIRNTVAAIEYAVQMGADIINYSAGGASAHAAELKALRRAEAKGILVVAAAGNDGRNSDVEGYYPASYGLTNILAVTAHGPEQRLLKTSNFGAHGVAISAPGSDIRSTLPGGGFGPMTGTSQATAIASGVAAQLMATRRDLDNPVALIQHLEATGRFTPGLLGKVRSGNRLNMARAMNMRDSDVDVTGRRRGTLPSTAVNYLD